MTNIDDKVDFGTYHHTSREESDKIRSMLEKVFSNTLLSLYPSDSKINVLDAGCGLGFLTAIAARCFPQSKITCVDIFDDESLSGNSIERTIANMRILGIDSRVEIIKHDLTKPLERGNQYDVVMSNLVFHNLGDKRFSAYETIFKVIKEKGTFILADLFPNYMDDIKYFNERYNIINNQTIFGSSKWAYRLLVMNKK